MNTLKVGDLCSIMDKGNRVDCVVVSTRLILKGQQTRMTEYTLGPISIWDATTVVDRVVGEKLLGVSSGKYYTDEQIEAAAVKARRHIINTGK